jgi:hypothetical protein
MRNLERVANAKAQAKEQQQAFERQPATGEQVPVPVLEPPVELGWLEELEQVLVPAELGLAHSGGAALAQGPGVGLQPCLP